jgi:uncharacterized protein YvpB
MFICCATDKIYKTKNIEMLEQIENQEDSQEEDTSYVDINTISTEIDDEVETKIFNDEEVTEEVEEEEIPNSFSLDVENIMQNPELPTGCEITSLTIVLNYLGYNVDKCYLADNYLTKGEIGTVTPYQAFLGNPRSSSSYGCYSPVIVKAANSYLSDVESNLEAYDYVGTEFEDLYKEIYEGRPIIVWATINLIDPYYTTKWVIDGEEFQWKANEHCLVLYGYDVDNNLVYIADPLVGNVTYDLDVFKDRYEKMYYQAVVIK